MDIVVGIFGEEFGVGLGGRVDGEFDRADRPGVIPSIGVAHADVEFVAIGKLAGDLAAVGQRNINGVDRAMWIEQPFAPASALHNVKRYRRGSPVAEWQAAHWPLKYFLPASALPVWRSATSTPRRPPFCDSASFFSA